MKAVIASLSIAGAATAWALAGAGNTIILSGWPPAESCSAVTGGVAAVEACAPTVAAYALATMDGRAAAVAESAPSTFSSCRPGSMFIFR